MNFRQIMQTGVRALAVCLLLCTGLARQAAAADPPSDFSLQVTPSPLVTTVKPGVKTQLELKVRNGGSGTENLKIEPRSFTLSNDGNSVNLQDTTPPDISTWISFSAAKFTVQPGEFFSEKVILNVPKTAGFSYSFALVISRQSDPVPTGSGRLIKGSLAVFTLVNVDRPGATSSLQVTKFNADKHLYEYLPATFSIRFHNTGNTIAQPYGNIFIEHGADAHTPLATLAVNENKGYILPGSERTISTGWNDGFPAYRTSTNADGTTSTKLVWNWTKLSQLRIGRYTARLVAVYNQAGHDVPIEGSVSFWVIPWKILLGLLLVALLLLFAIFMLVRMLFRSVTKRRKKRTGKKTSTSSNPPSAPAE